MKTLAVLLAAATLAFAQEKGAPAKPVPTALNSGEVLRVIDVKQGDAATIHNNLSTIFSGITRVNNQLIVRGQPAVADAIEAAIKKLDVPSGEIVRVIDLKYVEVNAVRELQHTFPGMTFTSSSAIVRGQPDLVARAEAAIKAIDVPKINVEYMVQLLQGSPQEVAGAQIPTDLESTVRQLRSAFAYKGYKVLETQVLRARGDGRQIEMNGTLPGSTTSYSLQFQPTAKAGTAPRLVELRSLRLGLQFPYSTPDGKGASAFAGINADLDLREGQKTVIGKANLRGSEDAIFLVITPKVVE
jgi:hypothetical protein